MKHWKRHRHICSFEPQPRDDTSPPATGFTTKAICVYWLDRIGGSLGKW